MHATYCYWRAGGQFARRAAVPLRAIRKRSGDAYQKSFNCVRAAPHAIHGARGWIYCHFDYQSDLRNYRPLNTEMIKTLPVQIKSKCSLTGFTLIEITMSLA